ncbi:MAG: hypothetical protein M9918_15515 [Anaerolineae bacterium]|nr:hypothetical protein [Anaerolineae bacterium]
MADLVGRGLVAGHQHAIIVANIPKGDRANRRAARAGQVGGGETPVGG